MKCRICNNILLKSILSLGETPWCNDFKYLKDPESEKYPLELVYCSNCTLTQLNHTVKKETMFKNHTYVSGTTKTLTDHFYNIAFENKKQFNLQPHDLIVDIGGNDGTQLLQYKKLGLKNLINVESADNIAKLSLDRGIFVINNFFNEELIDKYPTVFNNAMIINAAGVFFHLEELHSVCKGIKKLLNDEGVFIVQFMYLGDMIEQKTFDAIYHEHLCYYTLHSLSILMNMYNMRLLDAYRHPIHGGSIIAKFVHNISCKPITNRAKILLENENIELTALMKFAENIKEHKQKIISILKELKLKGKKIYGLGSPASGTTLLNYCGINTKYLDKLVEVNTLKVGLVSPGTNIPIELESENDLPDVYFVLAHKFINEILEKNKHLLNKVTFLIPLPDIKFYGKKI